MGDIISAAADRAPRPGIEQIKNQRRVGVDRRVQAGRRFPGPETDAGNEFTIRFGRLQGDSLSVASDDVPIAGHARDPYLQTLERGIDVAGGAAGRVFLPHDVPRFECLTQFDFDPAMSDAAIDRKAKLEVGQEPRLLKSKSSLAHVAHDVTKILPDKIRKHEPVVQLRVPAHQWLLVRLAPETGDQGP